MSVLYCRFKETETQTLKHLSLRQYLQSFARNQLAEKVHRLPCLFELPFVTFTRLFTPRTLAARVLSYQTLVCNLRGYFGKQSPTKCLSVKIDVEQNLIDFYATSFNLHIGTGVSRQGK